MANYIEREDDTSSDNGNNSTVVIKDSNEFDRWDWLLCGWDDMSDTDRMLIFMPYLHYVNLRDFYKVQFDEKLNQDISENAYKLCRNFGGKFKFDPDQQGAPNMIIVYDPIDIESIPYDELKTKIKRWGKKYGLYKDPVNSSNIHYCNCESKKDTVTCTCKKV